MLVNPSIVLQKRTLELIGAQILKWLWLWGNVSLVLNLSLLIIRQMRRLIDIKWNTIANTDVNRPLIINIERFVNASI